MVLAPYPNGPPQLRRAVRKECIRATRSSSTVRRRGTTTTSGVLVENACLVRIAGGIDHPVP